MKTTFIISLILLFSLSSQKNRNLAEAVIINADFEDNDYKYFSPRGDNVKLSISNDEGQSTGNNYLLVSGRERSWNGVNILLDNICTVGIQYIVSCKLKTRYYATLTLSMQYTDAAGTDHYNNLKSVVSSGGWIDFPEFKFSMLAGVSNVYLYFESGSADADIFIDDFVLKEAPEIEIQNDIASLKDVFQNHFKVGTALTVAEIAPKSTQKLILKHFNSITLGNELKPDAVLDQKATLAYAEETNDYTTPKINIGAASVILDFCRDNKIPVRGHTLVWHSQTPTWFFKEKWDINNDWVDKETMLKRMENYIKVVFETVGDAYPDVDFYAWDVVNEAWLDNGVPREGGSQEENRNYSPWVKIFGDNSFIKYAFQYARKYAFPNCKLYYNDFNEYMNPKTKAMIAMVQELNAEEKLIDGLGLQSHLDVNFPSVSVYEKAVRLLAETGVDLQITELDVTVNGNSEENFKTQAEYYQGILDVLVRYHDYISCVVFWGTLDSTSWRSSRYPLLFNEDYTAKKSFYYIVELIDPHLNPEYEEEEELEEEKIDPDAIIATSFENRRFKKKFFPRGISVKLSIGTDGAYSGNNYLLVANRVSSWNGVQILLDDYCTPGKQYLLSSYVRARYYGTISLSMQYTDSDGVDHYTNLKSVVSPGSWVQFENHKFVMPLLVTKVYLYFECNSNDDLFIDDFILKEAPELEIETDIPSLKDSYEKYFKIGTAVTVNEIVPKTTQKLVLKHFNSITLGNELKPDAILNQKATLAYAEETGDYTKPVISIGAASIILDFCQQNNIPVRGHTFVWHSQTPTWFFKEKWDAKGDWVDQDTMLRRMENFIRTVFETIGAKYPTIDFYAWDVVNEALLDTGKPRTGGSQEENANYSPWVKIFGDNSFIKYAFQYAKKYVFPNCKLYYNDFNEYMPDKTKAIVALVEEINSSEKLIDGIGLQSHLDVSFPGLSAYEKGVKTLAETGLDLQITELDVTVNGNTEDYFKTQATYYKNIMDILVKYSDSISSVVFWGTLDSTSWRSAKYPLLFNEDYTAKQAFYSLVGTE